MAKRTAFIRKLVQNTPAFNELSKEAVEGFWALLDSLGTVPKEKTVDDQSNDDDGEVDDKTRHLLFLSDEEAVAIAEFAKVNAKDLEKAITTEPPKATRKAKKEPSTPQVLATETATRRIDSKLLIRLQKRLDEYLEAIARPVDVALFGRFLTSPGLPNVDAALQVAHALGVEPAVIEPDYFTAVDDLSDTSGAGHLGEREIAASVFYKYAACDLRLLVQNLCPRTRRAIQEGKLKDGRVAEEVEQEKSLGIDLAVKSLRGLVAAAARAVPSGMKNSTAPQNPAHFVHVVLRGDAPMSLANAFLSPVRAEDGKEPMTMACDSLLDLEKSLEHAYGSGDKRAFTLRVGEKGSPSLESLCKNIDEAVRKVLSTDPLLMKWGKG